MKYYIAKTLEFIFYIFPVMCLLIFFYIVASVIGFINEHGEKTR